jgi:hypothetical protein
LHVAGEKFRRAAARVFGCRDWRKIRALQAFVIEMAMPPVHENERAGKPDTVRTRYFRFDESRVLAAPKQRRGHLDITGERPDKSNLRRLQWRQIFASFAA